MSTIPEALRHFTPAELREFAQIMEDEAKDTRSEREKAHDLIDKDIIPRLNWRGINDVYTPKSFPDYLKFDLPQKVREPFPARSMILCKSRLSPDMFAQVPYDIHPYQFCARFDQLVAYIMIYLQHGEFVTIIDEFTDNYFSILLINKKNLVL